MSNRIAKRRFRFTLDRFLIGLLAVECLLWLSKGFRWFPFNYGKGWTVLLAMAVVAIIISFVPLWPAASFVFRRRFQFSIQSLFVLTLALAIPLGWFVAETRQVKREQEIARVIDTLDGRVEWSQQRSGPEWLQRLMGDEFFEAIVAVDLENRTEVTDADLERFARLSGLRRLNLTKTHITDAGLAHLKGQCQLQRLILNDTKVTDAGLANLAELHDLQLLTLCGTQITDAGLARIEGLTQIQELGLAETQITDAGLEHLKGLSQLHRIGLGSTRITDAGLVHFKGLEQLHALYFHNTSITDAGLEHLKGMSQLEILVLEGTRTTSAGVANLKEALPNCDIDPALRIKTNDPAVENLFATDDETTSIFPSNTGGLAEKGSLLHQDKPSNIAGHW